MGVGGVVDIVIMLTMIMVIVIVDELNALDPRTAISF